MSIQGDFNAIDQDGSGEGFGQEANGPGFHGADAEAFLGEGCDENKWRVLTPSAHIRQKV